MEGYFYDFGGPGCFLASRPFVRFCINPPRRQTHPSKLYTRLSAGYLPGFISKLVRRFGADWYYWRFEKV